MWDLTIIHCPWCTLLADLPRGKNIWKHLILITSICEPFVSMHLIPRLLWLGEPASFLIICLSHFSRLPIPLVMTWHGVMCQPIILFPPTPGRPKYFWGKSNLASWTLASLMMWQTQWNSVPGPFSCIVLLFFQIQFKPFVSHPSQDSKGPCHIAISIHKYKFSFGLLLSKEKISLFLIFLYLM